MIYYPVVVPTLNRYEHLRRLVDSLAKNTHADKTELIIGLDYPPSDKYVEGYDKIKNWIPSISGFKKITVLTTEKNIGAAKNAQRLLNYAREQGYDGYIFSEDDNEFSPCFLDYINKAMQEYKNISNVMTICGYAHIEYEGHESVYLAQEMSAWGYATWFKKRDLLNLFKSMDSLNHVLNDFHASMKLFRKKPVSLNSLITLVSKKVFFGDYCYTIYCLLNDSYSLFPSLSLVRNWGCDGTGLHCKPEEKNKNNHKISSELLFNLDEIPIEERKEIRQILRKLKTKHWYGNLAILLRYFVWRIFHYDFFKCLEKVGLIYKSR